MAGQVGKLGNTAVRIEDPDGNEFYAVRIFGPDGRIAVGEFQSATDRNWTVNLPRTLAQTGGSLPTSDQAALLFAATRTGSYLRAQSVGREGKNAYLNQVANFQGDPNTEFGQSEKIIYLNSSTPQGQFGLYGARWPNGSLIQTKTEVHGGSYADYSHTGIIAIFAESELPPGISVVEPGQQYSDISSNEQRIVNNAGRGTPADLPPDSGDFTTGEGAGPGGASPGSIDESEYYIINQRDRKILDFIASKESNGRYDAIYPGERRNSQITKFSINQLLQFQQNMTQGFADPAADAETNDAERQTPAIDPAADAEIEDAERRAFYSRTSAAGRYQFVPSQIKEAADFLELDRDLVTFSEPVQDAMCMEILKQKCDYEDWLQGTIIVEDFQFKLSGQFESIPLPCGGSSTDLDSVVAPTAGPDDGSRGDDE